MYLNDSVDRALTTLVRFEYDALAACRSAMRHCSRPSDFAYIKRIEWSHERHIQCLSPALLFVGARIPRAGDWRQLLTRGRVLTASVFGNDALLAALKDNEVDLAQAYRQALAVEDMHEGIRARLREHAMDCSRNHRWLRLIVDARDALLHDSEDDVEAVPEPPSSACCSGPSSALTPHIAKN